MKKPIKLHKRRESVQLNTFSGKGDDKLKFIQRVPPFQPIMSNQNKNLQKNDCQSTNSGSGNELVKPKQFDFLKKKKEMKQQGTSGNNTPVGNIETVKQVNPLKKSEIIWPLSISPMEQKVPKIKDQ